MQYRHRHTGISGELRRCSAPRRPGCFPQQLGFGRSLVIARTGVTAPRAATPLTDEFPSTRTKRGAAFRWQRVGADALVAESESSLRGRAIQERTGVPRPVCAEARDFQGYAVVTHP